MAGKPRKRQSRKAPRRSGRRRAGWPRLPGRLGLVATVCLAILTGAALGYGLGVLNRKPPERTVATAVEPPAKTSAKTPRGPAVARSAPAETPRSAGIPRIETEREQPRPAVRSTELAWMKNAASSGRSDGAPAIAIVIDDVGLNPAQTRKVTALPAPITLAFLTYADRLPEQAATARAAGHELLVHFPMEPSDPAVDPGPNALLASLGEAEISRRLVWGLSRFDGYVGVNNHMGSLFTADEARMTFVLRELKRRGLLFLDSATTTASTGERLSAHLGLPHARRNVFLDNSKDPASIRESLAALERHAVAHGQAIGIGHPYDETIEELARWISGARDRGFALVPVTSIVRRNGAHVRKLGGEPADPAG